MFGRRKRNRTCLIGAEVSYDMVPDFRRERKPYAQDSSSGNIVAVVVFHGENLKKLKGIWHANPADFQERRILPLNAILLIHEKCQQFFLNLLEAFSC